MNHKTYNAVIQPLRNAGISESDAIALRRISMTLKCWFEAECNGWIQRDEETGKPRSYNTYTNEPYTGYIADRETGALKRLAAIVSRYPGLSYYVQGDPRGASLYILRPDDIPEGKEADSYYSRGIAVYQ